MININNSFVETKIYEYLEHRFSPAPCEVSLTPAQIIAYSEALNITPEIFHEGVVKYCTNRGIEVIVGGEND